jgi:hypothetical protein
MEPLKRPLTGKRKKSFSDLFSARMQANLVEIETDVVLIRIANRRQCGHEH